MEGEKPFSITRQPPNTRGSKKETEERRERGGLLGRRVGGDRWLPPSPFSLKAAFFTPCGVRQAGGNQERLGGVNTAQRQEEESGGAREEGKEEGSKGDVERQRGGGGGDKVAISRGISQRKVQGKIYDGG